MGNNSFEERDGAKVITGYERFLNKFFGFAVLSLGVVYLLDIGEITPDEVRLLLGAFVVEGLAYATKDDSRLGLLRRVPLVVGGAVLGLESVSKAFSEFYNGDLIDTSKSLILFVIGVLFILRGFLKRK